MANTIDKEMAAYFMQLNDAEKKSVVQMLKTFLKARKTKPEPINLEQYNQELREAEAEYERGEYSSHEEFVKKVKKW